MTYAERQIEAEIKALNARHSYRPHRGGYQEAAAERVYFNTPGDLRAYLENLAKTDEFFGRTFPGPYSTKFYAEDHRMKPSESYIVLDANGRPVGFSSVPLNV